MPNTTQTGKRSNACVPCHQRKVRCDAADVGTPCSRCVSKSRSQDCTLLPARHQRRSTKHSSRYGRAEVLHQRQTTASAGAPAETPDTALEEDAQVRTLQLMTHKSNPTCLSLPTSQSNETQATVIEYFDRLNSVSILSEVLGQRQQKRLIHLGFSQPGYLPAKQRELAGLEPADLAYLEAKGVFNPPSTAATNALLRLWFEHVFPYTPVLEPAQFYEDYVQETCSHFLIYALLANVASYASSDHLIAAGYTDRSTAQQDFLLKARLLYDFGCEKQQLAMLQGCAILSSVQGSFAPIKDFRFWFYNAVRIATQMGLHRQNLGEDLDPATYKLCRRIWWVLYARDVLFALSGFSNSRCINDAEADVAPLTEDDWDLAPLSQKSKELLQPTTRLHRCFFIQNCQLALLAAKFLRITRESRILISPSTAHDFAKELTSLRRSLPEVLDPTRITTWTTSNVWIIILMALFYRLECVFFRTAREHFRQSNDQTNVVWCKQQLFSSVFELDTFMSRAIVHDLVQFAPGSMIVCACNLLAFHIETALDEGSSLSQIVTAKTRIHAILAYLHDVGEAWRMAKWTFRVSEWVVKRAGLMLKADSSNPGYEQDRNNMDATDSPFASDFTFNPDAFTENWVQDFLGQNFVGQLHDDLFNFGHG